MPLWSSLNNQVILEPTDLAIIVNQPLAPNRCPALRAHSGKKRVRLQNL